MPKLRPPPALKRNTTKAMTTPRTNSLPRFCGKVIPPWAVAGARVPSLFIGGILGGGVVTEVFGVFSAFAFASKLRTRRGCVCQFVSAWAAGPLAGTVIGLPQFRHVVLRLAQSSGAETGMLHEGQAKRITAASFGNAMESCQHCRVHVRGDVLGGLIVCLHLNPRNSFPGSGFTCARGWLSASRA